MMLYVKRIRRAGFTLIEIMIVIAIIAILAGIVVPSFMQARAEAQYTACLQNCETIAKAVEMMSVRHSIDEIAKMVGCIVWNPVDSHWRSIFGSGPCYMSTADLIEHGYLEHDVACPVNGQGYGIAYNGIQSHWEDWNDWPDWVVFCPGNPNTGSGHFIGAVERHPVFAVGEGAHDWYEPRQ